MDSLYKEYMGNMYNSHGEASPRKDSTSSPGFFGRMFQGFTNLNKKTFNAVLSYVSPFMLDRPTFTNWNTEEAIKNGYIASHVVNACIRFRANSAASVPWIVQEKDKAGVWRRVQDHPLENLIEHPNEQKERFGFIYSASVALDACGNALAYITLYKGTPMELILIQPDRIRPIPDKKKFISGYQFSPKGTGISGSVDPKNFIKPENIIHWMLPNPADPFWGIGPLQALGRIVDTEIEATKFQNSSLRNKAVKDGILSFKKHLNRAQWELINDEFRSQIAGADNARGPIVLSEEATYQPFSMTPAELDFTNSRKMSREDICIGFLVPPPLIGILEHSSYANSDAARITFWNDTMVPHLELLAEGFNRSLVPHFGDPEKLRVMYDLSQVPAMNDSLYKAAEIARKLFEIGYPINVINARIPGFNMPEIEGGDSSYIPGNLMVPADIKVEGESDPTLPENRPKDDEGGKTPSKTTTDSKNNKPVDYTKDLPDCCFGEEGER